MNRGNYIPREVLRGKLKFFILQALAEKPMHGYEIRKCIGEYYFGFWKPSFGTLYPTLKALKEEKLIEVEKFVGKRGVKVYRITEKGLEHLKRMQKSIEKANKAMIAFYKDAKEEGFEFGELVEAFALLSKFVRKKFKKYRGVILRFLLFVKEKNANKKDIEAFLQSLGKFLETVEKINKEIEERKAIS